MWQLSKPQRCFSWHFSTSKISWGQQLGTEVCNSKARGFSTQLIGIQFSLPCCLHQASEGLPTPILEIKFLSKPWLFYSLGFSPRSPAEFCFLIAACPGNCALADDKVTQWRPCDARICLPVSNPSLINVKKGLGDPRTSPFFFCHLLSRNKQTSHLHWEIPTRMQGGSVRCKFQ